MKPEHISEIKAIIILAIGMIVLASLISFVPEDLSWYTSLPNNPAQNLIRISGAYLAGSLLFVFGFSAYFLVVFLFFWAWNKFALRELKFTFAKFVSFLVLFCVVSSLLSMTGAQEGVYRFDRAGVVGITISDFLIKYLGAMGSYIVLIMLGVMALILTGEFLITPVVLALGGRIKEWYLQFREKAAEGAKAKPVVKAAVNRPNIHINHGAAKKGKVVEEEEEYEEEDEEEYDEEDDGEYEDEDDEEYEDEDEDDEEYEDDEEDEDEEDEDEDPNIKIVKTRKVKKVKDKKIVNEYKIPSLNLLADPPEIKTDKIQDGLITGAKLLEETLAQFGVNARVADIERGPAITRYELEPGPGVKVQKFTTLSDDIALAMKAPAVRIVAPIPGKNRVGIEVPNGTAAAVFLKDVLSSDEFQRTKSKLTISLGKDISGKAMVADLATMPHLLIAGTTGAGKTVCVNGIIMSILLNATPDEVKFIMVDPKMVEMVQYQDIPHLLAPPVTDSKKAGAVLSWVVTEMENRYKALSKARVRNIQSYNDKGNKMPYIVVIVDELADLMLVSAKTVEAHICRLAQLSRAVGIHLILATQRPSVNVITGVIKANLPARISFKVASKIDSRTVLDMNGAESLLGRGDLLFIQPGDAKPTRGQGNFVSDDEINAVIDEIKKQRAPTYNDEVLSSQKKGVMGGGSEEKDEMYDEAVALVVQTSQASVSILQRRMRLGYTRAARLIDMMEQNGIVGPYCGSKARGILVDREQWMIDNMQNED
ncbi:MAG: S-DNA-T family DNA segregation ATPase FtsK/SpoIIIE [Candidatus Omnitrophota bacterium]|jgi:S-DNA-T family DNA segregation ATPase FtsK/SpoIIIE